MSISDLYPTGLHQQNIGHFATIVRLALLDNKINSEEHKLLKRLARRLDITKGEFKMILKNPESYPVNPPVSYDQRLACLYDLTKMMFLDKNPTIDKTSIIQTLALQEKIDFIEMNSSDYRSAKQIRESIGSSVLQSYL